MTYVLKDWSLFVNKSKTVFTRVYLAETDALDAHGNKIRGDEEWRESVVRWAGSSVEIRFG